MDSYIHAANLFYKFQFQRSSDKTDNIAHLGIQKSVRCEASNLHTNQHVQTAQMKALHYKLRVAAQQIKINPISVQE